MTNTYDNNTDLANATLAAAIKSGLIPFAESFHNRFQNDISPCSHELTLTLYDAIRDKKVDKITFAIKIGIPFEKHMFTTAIEDANLDVFKVIFDAYTDELSSETYVDRNTLSNYTALAIKYNRSDIAEFLISKGIGLNGNDYQPKDIVYALSERDNRKINTACVALNQAFAKKFTVDDLPQDNYAGELLPKALIHHDDMALLDLIANTPMFTKMFYSQNSINAAYYYGFTQYIEYVKTKTGSLPKATRDPIKGRFSSSARSGTAGAFIHDVEQFAQALYVAGPAHNIENYEAERLLRIALEKRADQCAYLVCKQTDLFSNADTYHLSSVVNALMSTPTSPDVLQTVIRAMPKAFLTAIDADIICGVWDALYRKIASSKHLAQIRVTPLLNALSPHLSDDAQQEIMQRIALTGISSAYAHNDNPPIVLLKQVFEELRSFTSALSDINLHDYLKERSYLEGKSAKQCLAALRTSYYGQAKNNLYNALILLAVADASQRTLYIDAFAGKALKNDIAFTMACDAWDITPLDMLNYHISKGAKQAIMTYIGHFA